MIGVCANLLGLDRYEIEDTLDQQIELHRYFTMERGKTFVFLPVFYLAEQYIATRIYEMLEKEPEDVESLEAVIDLEEEACGLQYAPLQRKAIREAIANDIFILTGGPGTGKTTILNAVISILEQQGYHVGICAPTGRAAKRLSEVTGQNATTIHRMLGVQMQRGEQQEFVHHEHNPLKYDAIIAQEPCEATEHIIRLCTKEKKDFIISLCASPHRLINGKMPRSIDEWYEHLIAIDPNHTILIYPNMVPGYNTPVMIGMFRKKGNDSDDN